MAESLNLRLAGAAGQGIQSAAELLGRALTRAGAWVRSRSHVESRVRGGLNWMDVRCGTVPPRGESSACHVLAALNDEAARALLPRLDAGGLLLAPSLPDDGTPGLALADAIARAGKRHGSMVFLGALAELIALPEGILVELAAERWKDDEAREANGGAIALGRKATTEAGFSGRLAVEGDGRRGRLWVTGHDAVSLGAVAGGVSFMAAYPMSPATGILSRLADFSKELDLVVLQCEDEIAAMNLAVGAGFAGGRALTATSGGGFCLMTEGLSLAAIVESPVVCVLAQRPGPATGMATRSAQDDLLFAIHGGHGPMPRIVLAPADHEEAFHLTAAAFDLAETWQCPVLLLTDQALQDGAATVEPFELDGLPRERHGLIDDPSDEDAARYRRYAPGEDGLSPMAWPGASKRLVVADSHTHDEAGHITETPEGAVAQSEKLLDKMAALAEVAWQPPLPETLHEDGFFVLSWGSTGETVARACALLEDEGAHPHHVHLSWMWPAPADALRRIAESGLPVVTVECGMTGAFADYVRHHGGRAPDLAIRRLDGRLHTVEELHRSLHEEVLP